MCPWSIVSTYLPPPSYSRGAQTNIAWLRRPGERKQSFTVNLIVGIKYLMWSRVSGRRLQRLSGYLLETISGPVVFLECAGFEHPKPTELPFTAHLHRYLYSSFNSLRKLSWLASLTFALLQLWVLKMLLIMAEKLCIISVVHVFLRKGMSYFFEEKLDIKIHQYYDFQCSLEKLNNSYKFSSSNKTHLSPQEPAFTWNYIFLI